MLYDEDQKRVLLHRRDHNTTASPDTWDCFGGEIEGKETENEAFLRELYEELGLIVAENDVSTLSFDRVVYYLVPFKMWETPKISLREGAGFAWLSLEYIYKLPGVTDEATKVLESFKTTSIGKEFININK